MANIQNELNNIKNAIYGKDVRNSIHDAIKTCYDDASVNNDNANMEVKLARGTHNTLNDRLCEVDEKQNSLSSQLDYIAYSPLMFGDLKENDENYDNAPVISKCIQYVWDNYKTGKIIIPHGVYYVNSAIRLYPGIRIVGSGSGSESFTTTTTLKAKNGYSGYILANDDDVERYMHYASIENIHINGNDSSSGVFFGGAGESSYIRDVHFKNCNIGLKFKYPSAKTFVERVTINGNKIGVEMEQTHGTSDLISLSGDGNNIPLKITKCGNSTTINVIGLKLEDHKGTTNNPCIYINDCDGVSVNVIGGFINSSEEHNENTFILLEKGVTTKNKIVAIGFKMVNYTNFIKDTIDNKTVLSTQYENNKLYLYNTTLNLNGQGSVLMNELLLQTMWNNNYKSILHARSDGKLSIQCFSGSGGSIRKDDGVAIAEFGMNGSKQFRFNGVTHVPTINTNTSCSVGQDYECYFIDCNGYDRTVTLNNPSDCIGRKHIIKKTDKEEHRITLTGNVNNGTNYILDNNNKSVTLISDGETWQTI